MLKRSVRLKYTSSSVTSVRAAPVLLRADGKVAVQSSHPTTTLLTVGRHLAAPLDSIYFGTHSGSQERLMPCYIRLSSLP